MMSPASAGSDLVSFPVKRNCPRMMQMRARKWAMQPPFVEWLRNAEAVRREVAGRHRNSIYHLGRSEPERDCGKEGSPEPGSTTSSCYSSFHCSQCLGYGWVPSGVQIQDRASCETALQASLISSSLLSRYQQASAAESISLETKHARLQLNFQGAWGLDRLHSDSRRCLPGSLEDFPHCGCVSQELARRQSPPRRPHPGSLTFHGQSVAAGKG
ncbi:hypothetical protein B0T19DRAFT_240158 [Cercophora scortea]|uniref:Uncharacterized protein n=1 Tax=Cercophora scortea TaxID=314031 RepID=A0AAE0M6J7_9PEZI|nr:hypothetical protein B0T19DRAFT_240158 [Cercophora scortea]